MAPVSKTPRARKGQASQTKRRALATDGAGKPRPSDDQVATRAYELFLQRGGTHGEDVNDWLSAERQLLLE